MISSYCPLFNTYAASLVTHTVWDDRILYASVVMPVQCPKHSERVNVCYNCYVDNTNTPTISERCRNCGVFEIKGRVREKKR